MLSWQHSFYARILFIFVNIYCQPSVRFLGNLEKFPFFIMSSLDHEYNNFSLIQFLLSNIMTLVLSILTIYHCILSHFMIETVRILSLFNIFPDSMYFFFPTGTSVWRCSWLQLAVDFLTLFMVIWIFFERRLLNGNFNFAVTFSCQSFLFSTLFRVTLASLGIFSLLICFNAAPFYFLRRGTRPTPYN